MNKTTPALLAVMLVASAAYATTFPSMGSEHLAGFTQMAGRWTLEGKWANGNPIKARQTFETILGGKFVACHTWSASGDAPETERDYVLFGLDKDMALTQWVYTPDGQCRQTTATPTTDRTIQFDWTKTDDKGKVTELRQVITPIDANRYGWKMQMHIKGEWHTLLDGEWKRSEK